MQHIIQNHVFDIEFSDAGRAYALQDRISDIFSRQLVPRMESLFDSLVPAEATLVFDDVHIDIGSIDINLLDDDLAGRILAELEKVIRESISLGRNIHAEPTGGEPRIKTQGVNRIEMLRYFLLTGAMPWWATDDLAAEPVKLIEYLLAHDAAGLRQLILDAGKFDYVRRRMVYQFSDEVIRNIITLLEPAEVDFIFDYHASATEAHRRDELVKSAPGQEFEKALWVFILTYLLIDRGTLFNQKAFLQSTIGQMAQHYNRDYAELLTLLARTLGDDKLSPVKNDHLA
ncbi:MAG: hypothetical protein JSU01_09400, partial [Bacteroidetes bacterium]|nr:hypothetical protein [Bacteroidota bacterium]